MRRLSGWLLIGYGIFHLLAGIFYGGGQLKAMAAEGFFNTIGTDFSRAAIFWYYFSGLLFILSGHLVWWIQRKKNLPLPAFVGWELLVLCVIGVILMPLSGFWLVLLLAVYMIFDARKFGV